jgi:hypothetical protein
MSSNPASVFQIRLRIGSGSRKIILKRKELIEEFHVLKNRMLSLNFLKCLRWRLYPGA